MHPNPAFRPDPAGLLEHAAAIGFAHIFAGTPDGPIVAHAPVTLHGAELRFHLARANRLHPHLDGATVLLSIAGPHGYISPTWYANTHAQVPSWNYVAIEIDGVARAVPQAALLEQLDQLADRHEPRPNPWTRTKTDPSRITMMLRAIEGFAVAPTAVRGTIKLLQNKGAGDRAGVVAGLRARGEHALADATAAVTAA